MSDPPDTSNEFSLYIRNKQTLTLTATWAAASDILLHGMSLNDDPSGTMMDTSLYISQDSGVAKLPNLEKYATTLNEHEYLLPLSCDRTLRNPQRLSSVAGPHGPENPQQSSNEN